MATVAARRKPPEGWSFTAKEVSAGLYQATAVSPDGLHMSRTGVDDFEVLSKLIDDAWKLSE
jgi:hypothetical protein